MNENKAIFQLVWGLALLLAGIGVLVMMPEKMAQLEKIEHFKSIMFIVKFCFYLMAVVLMGGGAKKIYNHFKNQDNEENSRND